MEYALIGLVVVFVLRHLSASVPLSPSARPSTPTNRARPTSAKLPPALPPSTGRPSGGPAPSGMAGPNDLITVAEAESMARDAYQAYFHRPATDADIRALSNVANLTVYGGKVSRAAVDAFLHSPRALAAVVANAVTGPSAAPPANVRTVVRQTPDGLPSVVEVRNPATPDVVSVEVYDYVPPSPPAHPTATQTPSDLISMDAARQQAASAYYTYFRRAIDDADLAALSAAWPYQTYGGQVSQADVSNFLNSPAALAAVTH